MQEFKKVRGTMAECLEIEIGKDTVYKRSNIVRIDDEDFKGWEYDEIQYSLEEWNRLELDAIKYKLTEEFPTSTVDVSKLMFALIDENNALKEEIRIIKEGN